MSFLKWLFGPKEKISRRTLAHSTVGEFNSEGRLTNGGHSQRNIKELIRRKQKYHIVKTYKNGVRVGHVDRHTRKRKRSGINQSWFPKWWSDSMVKRAGQVVARGKKYKDGDIKTGFYGNVSVGIIRRNEQIATIFPMSIQKNRKGLIINEYKKTERTSS